VERLAPGQDAGPSAAAGGRVEFHYVLRRSNGYFVYSTTDAYAGDNDANGQPEFAKLGDGSLLPGLEEALEGQRAGARFKVLVPPGAGYQANPAGRPQVQGFGPKRQVESRKSEPFVFEVQVVKVFQS